MRLFSRSLDAGRDVGVLNPRSLDVGCKRRPRNGTKHSGDRNSAEVCAKNSEGEVHL